MCHSNNITTMSKNISTGVTRYCMFTTTECWLAAQILMLKVYYVGLVVCCLYTHHSKLPPKKPPLLNNTDTERTTQQAGLNLKPNSSINALM